MDADTLKELLFFIMTNKIKSTLRYGGEGLSFSLYGGDEPDSQSPSMDEIIAVRNDYITVLRKSPSARRTLHFIPLASILNIVTDSNRL